SASSPVGRRRYACRHRRSRSLQSPSIRFTAPGNSNFFAISNLSTGSWLRLVIAFTNSQNTGFTNCSKVGSGFIPGASVGQPDTEVSGWPHLVSTDLRHQFHRRGQILLCVDQARFHLAVSQNGFDQVQPVGTQLGRPVVPELVRGP